MCSSTGIPIWDPLNIISLSMHRGTNSILILMFASELGLETKSMKLHPSIRGAIIVKKLMILS